MKRSLVLFSLTAALPLAALAGCGGSASEAPSTTPQRAAAGASQDVLTCPERQSKTVAIKLINRTGIRLGLHTEPDSVTCTNWSLTGNPTNINTDGGRVLALGESFTWRLEAGPINRALTWTLGVDDVPVGVQAGAVALQLERNPAVYEGTNYDRNYLKAKGSGAGAKWECGAGNLVPIGTLREKTLFAQVEECYQISSPLVLAFVAR